MNCIEYAGLAVAVAILSGPVAAAAPKRAEPAPPAEVTAANMLIVRDTARDLAKIHGGEHVLVVYDIDNTLLTSTTALGSDQWFVWQDEKLPEGDAERITSKAEFPCLLDAQELLYATRPMRLTHESVMWSVESLRDDGFTQWVITSRGPEVAAVTFRELFRQRLEFSPFYGDPRTGPEDFKLGVRDLRLQDGVAFTSGANKGEVLKAILQRVGKAGEVRAIVFVDDTQKHLPRMRDAFDKSGIEVRTFLYEAVKADVDEFNKEGSQSKAEAKKQWCALVKEIPAIERSFASDVFNPVHEHEDGPKHSLSSCLINVCGQ